MAIDSTEIRFQSLCQLKTLDQFVPARAKIAPHTEALRHNLTVAQIRGNGFPIEI